MFLLPQMPKNWSAGLLQNISYIQALSERAHTVEINLSVFCSVPECLYMCLWWHSRAGTQVAVIGAVAGKEGDASSQSEPSEI